MLILESLWLDGSIPHGNSEFFLCPALVARRVLSALHKKVLSETNDLSIFVHGIWEWSISLKLDIASIYIT